MLWIILSLPFMYGCSGEDVKLSTCNAPVAQQTVSLCCITKNLPDRVSVFFSKNSTHVIRISQSCDLLYTGNRTEANFTYSCSKNGGNVTTYKVTFQGEIYSQDVGARWECGFYGRKAALEITPLDGHTFLYQNVGSSAIMSYNLSDIDTASGTVRLYKMVTNSTVLEVNVTDNEILHKDERVLYNDSVSRGQLWCEMRNVLLTDNGTYVCQYENRLGRLVRLGISIVVLGSPQRPTVVNSNNRSQTGKMASGQVTCDVQPGSAAPPFYTHFLETTWIYPTGDSWPPGAERYTVSTNGSSAVISDVNCERPSLPMYCSAMELGMSSDTSFGFYPRDLCLTNSSGDDGNPTYAALTIGLIFFVSTTVFVAVISAVIARRYLHRKGRRCLRSVRTCCLCCAKCLPSSDEDSDSDSDLERSIRRSRRDIGGLFEETPEVPRRLPIRVPETPLADGLRRGRNTHNDDVQQALERIAIEESRQNYERQLHIEGRDNPSYTAADDGARPSNVSEDSLVVRVDEVRPDFREAEGGAIEPRGAEGGAIGVRGAEREARASMSDDITILKEVETLIKQHHDHLNEQVVRLDIRREAILENLIAYYTEESLALSRVTVKMLGEEGMDCGGITLDMYTTFWARAQDRFFVGCDRVVPELPAHRFAEESMFRVLGRILSHSVAVMKAFPIPICKSTIIAMIYDTTEVASETLLEDFLYFLDEHERALATSAVNNYGSLTTDQVQELATVFERFNYGAMPNEETFKNHVIQLARHVTCIRPRQLLELMRSGIPPVQFEHFWSRFHIKYLDVLFMALRPTAERVIDRLKVHDEQRRMTRKQTRVLTFLKDLLKEMSEPELETFLHFVTGKKSIPRDRIIIQFTAESGTLRMPKAHTCSNMLELPDTYENYDTFRSELKHLMASEEALKMTME